MSPTCASARANSISRSRSSSAARPLRAASRRRAHRPLPAGRHRLELQGLRDRRASLDKVRREPEALVAPVSGVIADGHAGRGPDRADQRHRLPHHRSGAAVGRSAELRGNRRLAARIGVDGNGRHPDLTHRGAGFADRSQSIPIHFAVEGDAGGAARRPVRNRAGAPIRAKRGLAVPRASVVRGATARTSSTSTSRPNGSSRARCDRAARRRARADRGRLGAGKAHRRAGRRPSRSRALEERAMFTFLVTQSLRNRLFVLAMAGVLVIFWARYRARLPVDVFPDLNRPTVTIMTEAEGLAPPEVEQLVSFPIETADERRAGRHPRALGLGRRAVDRLRRVRLGHRHLSATASRSPNGSRSCRASCRRTSRRRWARSARSWARSC